LIKETLIKELNELSSQCASRENVEFVDLIYRYEGNRLVLRVLVDRLQGGITLGECALFNRQLKGLLEEKNIIDGDYVLEVCSPGLDRNLKTQKDFLRCINKEVVFFLNDLAGGKLQQQGIINKVDEHRVTIENSGQSLEIPLIKINKAQLAI